MIQAAHQTRKGLESLKNAFLLYLIGSILAFFPIVSIVGAVIDIVALIFLIISWRELGESNLKQAAGYESTGNWLLWCLIISIVVVILGIIIIVALFVSSIATQPITLPSNGTVVNPFQVVPQLRTFLYEILGVTAVAYIIWLAAWFKMCYSMKALAGDISQPKLKPAGNLYLIESCLGFANLFPLIFLFSSMNFTTTKAPSSPSVTLAPYSELLSGGYWTIASIISLAAAVLVVIGSYYGYKSLDRALASPDYYGQPSPPAPPTVSLPSYRNSQSPPYPQPQTMKSYCPHCGHKIENLNARTCPNCFGNL